MRDKMGGRNWSWLTLCSFLALFWLSFGVPRSQRECNHRLFEVKGDPQPGSNGFTLEIHSLSETEENSPSGYVPGKSYKISLRGWQTQYTVQTFRGFGIVAQFKDGRPAGKFEVPKRKRDRGDARIAPNCRSAGVSHANLRPKTSAHVVWRAPEAGDACITFRTSVIQSRHAWYADANELTKEFCAIKGYEKAIPVDDPNVQCCACDEAKYDIEFVGIWSKETHPTDFPTLEHLTHFTDFLGASHSNKYTMWKMGGIATDGLKEIAEWGNTYKGEQEMKANASEIRTIVKMKGLWYPEVQGRTTGHFHVTKYHNFASLAAMFGPSPDWCVGISQVNLCLPDCTWVEERVFDLQPWDAGSDDGETYMSPNNPAEPRHPIVPITTKTNPKSPFYNEASDEIPPLARIVIKRKQVLPGACKTDAEYQREAFNATSISEDEEYKDRRECMVSNWESWSLCSATCGKGIRMRSRVFVFPIKAQMFQCHRQLTERQFCNAKINECADSDAFNSKCAVTNWAEWAECSVTCGHGTRTRQRTLKNPAEADSCKIELAGHENCIGDNGDDCSVTPNPLCRTTSWSDWSPCSASCDDGVRIRTRLFYYSEHEDQCTGTSLMEKEKCSLTSCRRLLGDHSEEICQEEMEKGQCKGTFPRYWYNNVTQTCDRFVYTGCKGNRNQFETEEECKQFCVPNFETKNKAILPGHQLLNDFGLENEQVDDGGDPINCLVSEWSPWGNCSVACGRGKRQRNRVINIFARNGGTPCPPAEHMIQERHCQERPCARSNCRLGNWTRWSPCTVNCGEGTQVRHRIVSKPANGDFDENDPMCNAQNSQSRMCRMPCRQ